MADQDSGISWGKLILGAAGITAAVLVAPAAMTALGSLLGTSAAAAGGAVGEAAGLAVEGAEAVGAEAVASGIDAATASEATTGFLTDAGTRLQGWAGSLSSTYANIGESIGINALTAEGVDPNTVFTSIGEMYEKVLEPTGQQIINWGSSAITEDKFATAAVGAGVFGAGLTLGDWTGKANGDAARKSPNVNYAEYIEARRRAAQLAALRGQGTSTA